MRMRIKKKRMTKLEQILIVIVIILLLLLGILGFVFFRDNVTKKELKKDLDNAINDLKTLNNSISNGNNLLDKSYFEDIDNLVAYRKALAKETIKLGIRLDNYSMELGGGKYLFFNKALDVVSDAMPKKYEKEIKSYKKDIRKLNAKLAREENMSDESHKIVLY